MGHPVGTGPFRLADWRRSSRIVLERNPGYREDIFDGSMAADDTRMKRVGSALQGKRLPLVDRVEVYIIEEPQPRWLAFLNGEHELLDRLPNNFVNVATPAGQMAPNLKRRGIQMSRTLGADITYTVFNMKHPVIGGYTPEKVALRRAISLAMDVQEEIRIPRRGQALQAQAPINPHTYGYDPNFTTEMGIHDLPRAKALLDTYGYVDRNGDGWRELPNGDPLVIEHATLPDDAQRQLEEIRKRNFDKLGVRLELKYGKWPEWAKAARAGKFMTWGLGSRAASNLRQSSWTPTRLWPGRRWPKLLLTSITRNLIELYERIQKLPNSPDRLASIQGSDPHLGYPMFRTRCTVHRIFTDMWHPWVLQLRTPPVPESLLGIH